MAARGAPPVAPLRATLDSGYLGNDRRPPRSRTLLPRVVVAVLAAFLVAWFVVLLRDQQIGHTAVNRIVHHPEMSPHDWTRTMNQLRSAELLDPSTDWRMARANYLLLRDTPSALSVANSILRREPDNLSAWVIVLKANVGADHRTAARAVREIRRLNPSPTLSR